MTANQATWDKDMGRKGMQAKQEPKCFLSESQALGRAMLGPGSDQAPSLFLWVTLDMLLVLPEPQFPLLYNGRRREKQRDIRRQ